MQNEERLTAEAQAALDTVRRRIRVGANTPWASPSTDELILAALENLDARLRALEGKR